MLNKLVTVFALTAAMTGAAVAQQATTGAAPASKPPELLTTLPQNTTTVTNYYKQNVYDPSDSKIGEISDVLVGKDGKVTAFMISVGGFLGVGEKDVAVPFDAVHASEKNGKWYLTMNATKDSLKSARGYKFDKAKSTWEPA
jgi:sporulation protein YlmC with PRC-barrel domain